ncbi:Coatomer subunit beta'-3 [Camellia lanceoleosa]|uniref:Coatomer subunit beta'-3 n=1 Tax=Camellia lanceoleosa TaxID=1840588 RepID=A0ACC0F778_9ERIC|nr:Coatomer subunit beta'-3 [Camellia lanceoleosa]
MKVELNLLITEPTAKTTLLQENLAKEESEKLDAIECQRREKEAKVVAEKLQASLKEELEKAEERKLVPTRGYLLYGFAVRSTKFIVRKQWVVAGADDMYIRVYNYNTMDKVKVFEAHTDYIRCVDVHPTLQYVLSSSDDMLIKLWD